MAARLFLMVFGSGFIHIQSFPPLFFDEGGPSVSRDVGRVRSPRLSAPGENWPAFIGGSFPVVASVAASFALLASECGRRGGGLLLYTFAALFCSMRVACRLFGRLVAIALALLDPRALKWSIHPLYLGAPGAGRDAVTLFSVGRLVCFSPEARIGLWLVAAIALVVGLHD